MQKRNFLSAPIFLCNSNTEFKNKISVRSFAQNRGFTLIELMVAIVVLAILVASALPSYINHVERSKLSDGLATLTSLATSMEKNYLDYRNYLSESGACAVASPNSELFTFTCEATKQAFVWTALSKNGKYKYSIDQQIQKQTLLFDGSSVSDSNCWIVSSSGKCY